MEISNYKIKNIETKNWHYWLINYIPEPIRNIVGSFKDKVEGFFKTNTPKQSMGD